MPDNPYKRHKRVKNMRKVIREHGGKDPGGCVYSMFSLHSAPLDGAGCLMSIVGAMLFLVLLPFMLAAKLLDTYKIDSCALVLVAGVASWAVLATGAWQVLV